MVYTYVGKGTIVLGIRNKPVEKLTVGDRVLGYYIGVGTKYPTDSKVKSVRYVGKADCKLVGSRSEHALVADGQYTVDPAFKYTDVDDIVYSVGRSIPRPFKVNRVVPEVDIYEIELEDSDVVPLLTSYMFVVFTDKQLNFQGGLSGEEVSKEQFKQSERFEQTKEEDKQEEKNEQRRKSKRKRKPKSKAKSNE